MFRRSNIARAFKQPTPPQLGRVAALGVTLLVSAIPLIVQYAILPTPAVAPFVFLFSGVALVAWLCGVWYGLLSVALLALGGNFFFMRPYAGLSLSGPAVTATLLFLLAGAVIAFLCAGFRSLLLRTQDIASRANRDRAQLEASFEAISDGVMIFDMSGTAVLTNRAQGRLLGYASTEEMRQPLSHFVNNFEVADLEGRRLPVEQWPLSRVLRGQSCTDVELRVRRRGNTPEWYFDVSARPMLDELGRQVLAVVVTRDVTFRRRIEMGLRESESRFRELADAMPQLVWTADAEGQVEYYNERHREFSGIVHIEGVGWSWADGVHPDDLARTRAAWEHSLATGQPYELEQRARRRDGSYRWYLSRAVCVRDEQGRIKRWYGTATDIDAQKRAEDALREADQRKDEFLALLGHELRNPLAPIRQSLYVIERSAPGSEAIRRAQEVIGRQAAHMERIVDDLLDVSRVSRGKIHLAREPIDLNEVVRGTVDDHRTVFESHGVELLVQAAARPVWVRGDRTRLSQVLGNLLQNSVKFTPRGGQTVVSVGVEPERGHAVLSVRDTGIGIPDDVLPRLFEPFSQADMTLARTPGGLGLGLALVKGLVELHGGSVEGTSGGRGTGASFIVRLPISSPAAGRRGDVARPPGGGTKVLVIEDNVDAAESLRDALELDDFAVEVAHSGASGLEIARRFRPAAVLCDIGLPEMDGYQVARRVRADPALRSVYLVALSGYAQPRDVERARAAGFDRHIAKPPSLQELESVLAAAPRFHDERGARPDSDINARS